MFFDFKIRDECIMYDIVLNEVCLVMDHDKHTYVYHGCEFAREIIHRNFRPVDTRYTAIPAYVIPTFLTFINNRDYEGLDFCNFLCCNVTEIQNYTPGTDTYPRELDRINTGRSRVIFSTMRYTLHEYRTMVYKFLYNLSNDSAALTGQFYRKLVYMMAKIFKHKTTINETEPGEKVVAHFNNCAAYLLKHRDQLKRLREND